MSRSPRISIVTLCLISSIASVAYMLHLKHWNEVDSHIGIDRFNTQSRAKQVAMALELYAQDNDGKLPLAKTPTEKIDRFLRDPGIKASLNPNGGTLTFNSKLAGLKLDDLPRDVILVSETNLWPDSTLIVAYADGHTKSLIDSTPKR